MNNFEIHNPVRVHFGQGRVKQLGEITKEYGKRAFVLTMQDIRKLRLTEDAVSSLKEAGLDVIEYGEVSAEPTCTHVDEVAKQVREARADVVVAIGLRRGGGLGPGVADPDLRRCMKNER